MSYRTSTEQPRSVATSTAQPLSSIWLTSRLALGLFVTLFATLYVSGFIYRGWMPHDEGSMAQMAERVLAGELPHLHFDELYTGGLTLVHGLVFHLTTPTFSMIRLSLAFWIPPFVFAMYWLLSRHGSRGFAILTAACAVVWSVPNYFVALPSWHNLFLWVFGIVALLRFVDTGNSRWLAVAGFCGGVAIVFKITGLYFVAAVLLFLAFRQSVLSQQQAERMASGRSVGYSLFISLVSLTLAGLIWLLIRKELAPMEFLLFVVPGVSLCLCLAIQEWTVGRGDSWLRLRELLYDVSIFLAGIVPPILLFLLPYAVRDGLPELFHGVLIQPRLRMTFERLDAGSLASMIPALVPTILLLIWGHAGSRCLTTRQRWIATAITVMGYAWLMLPLKADGLFYWHYFTLRNLVPTLSVVGCAFLLGSGRLQLTAAQRQTLFLLIASASFSSLIQFPFSALIYFCYAAPLVILALHALVVHRREFPQVLAWSMMGILFLFGLVANTRYAMEYGSLGNQFNRALELPRAGLLVQQHQQEEYKQVIDLVTKHSREDSAILATPDCPEIYFLANRKNPTRLLFDFFDDAMTHDERMIELMDRLEIPVVVVNQHPQFSHKISPKLAAAINKRYPIRQQVGRMVVCLRKLAVDTDQFEPLAHHPRLEWGAELKSSTDRLGIPNQIIR